MGSRLENKGQEMAGKIRKQKTKNKTRSHNVPEELVWKWEIWGAGLKISEMTESGFTNKKN